MGKIKSQFNKRQPEKKVSNVGKVQRNRLRHRLSLKTKKQPTTVAHLKTRKQ